MNKYGLVPMSLKEEMEASAAVKLTRTKKLEAQIAMELIISICEREIKRAKSFQELNDEKHAMLIKDYTECIRQSLDCLDKIKGVIQ